MNSTPSTDLEVAPRARGDSSDTAPYAIEREIEDLAVLVDNLGEPETEASTGAGGGSAGRHPYPRQAQADGRSGQPRGTGKGR